MVHVTRAVSVSPRCSSQYSKSRKPLNIPHKVPLYPPATHRKGCCITSCPRGQTIGSCGKPPRQKGCRRYGSALGRNAIRNSEGKQTRKADQYCSVIIDDAGQTITGYRPMNAVTSFRTWYGDGCRSAPPDGNQWPYSHSLNSNAFWDVAGNSSRVVFRKISEGSRSTSESFMPRTLIDTPSHAQEGRVECMRVGAQCVIAIFLRRTCLSLSVPFSPPPRARSRSGDAASQKRHGELHTIRRTMFKCRRKC